MTTPQQTEALVTLPITTVKKLLDRLEFDASWDKTQGAYYEAKCAIETAARSPLSGEVGERIGEIEKRADAASANEWIVNNTLNEGGPFGNRVTIEAVKAGGGDVVAKMNSQVAWENDAEFIAHSRIDIPWLLTQLKSALCREKEAREALKPFAEAAVNLEDGAKDAAHIWESPAAMEITAGDLRRAALTHTDTANEEKKNV